MDYDKHTTKHKSDLPIEENNRCCYFKNPSKIELNKVKVDNGLLADFSQEKCDYIVHWSENHVVYIELKGTDLVKAFSQIRNTINLTKNRFSSFKFKECVIVCSRIRHTPKLKDKIRRLKIDLTRTTGVVPYISSQQHNYSVK